MAVHNFTGDAPTIDQQSTYTFTLTAISDVITATVDNLSVQFTTITAVNDDAATGIVSKLQASGITQMSELTYSVVSNVVTVTGPGNGREFVLVIENTGTGVAANATPVPGSGPNWWTAANFDTGVLPANTDDVFIDVDVPILYGLQQSSVKLGDLIIGDNYDNSSIGLPDVSQNGYFEYLPKFLEIGASRVLIGISDSTSKNGTYRINSGIHVVDFFTRGGTLELLCNQPSTIVNSLNNSTVNIASNPTDSSSIGNVHAGGRSIVYIGINVTGTMVQTQNNARLTSDSNPVTFIKEGTGVSTLRGTEAITTCKIVTGILKLSNASVVTTLDIHQDGIVTLEDAISDTDIQTILMNRGSVFKDPHGRRDSASTGYTLQACGINDVTIETPDGISLAVTYS